MRRVLKFSEIELLEQPLELLDNSQNTEDSFSAQQNEPICEKENIEQAEHIEHINAEECVLNTNEQADSVYHEIVEQAKKDAEKILQQAEEDAKCRADKIIKDAYEMSTKSSEEILLEAHKKLVEMEEAAREKGVLEGRQQGLNEQRELIEQLLTSFEEAILAVDKRHESFLSEWETELRWLALQISRKALDRLVTENELAMEDMILVAVDTVRDAEWIDIELSSGCTKLIGRLKQIFAGVNSISVDAVDLPYREARICTNSGILEVSIEQRLSNIERYFRREGI